MASKYRFGSHVSCSGGLVQGLHRAVESGCDCVQVFVSNPRQWPSLESLIPVEVPAKASSKKVAQVATPAESKPPVRSAAKSPVKSATKSATKSLAKSNTATEEATSADEADGLKQFAAAWKASGLGPAIAHTSYLINIASPDDGLWEKSLNALVIEWRRADQLQLEGLVMHPGACMKSSTEEGLARVAAAMDRAID